MRAHRLYRAGAALALLAVPLAAQTVDNSYPRVSFFVGTSPAIGDSGLLRVRESVQVGLEYSHPIWKGEVYVAAEWRTFRSRNAEVTQFSPRNADGTAMIGNESAKSGYAGIGSTTRGYITAFTRDPTPGRPYPNGIAVDMRFDSVHMAKNDLRGGSSKLAYRHHMESPYIGNWSLQGGLTISFLTASEWANGDIHVLSNREFSQNNVNTAWNSDDARLNAYGRLFNDVFFQDNSEIKVLPGAFIGTRFLLNDNLFFETNITMLGHASLTYVPTAYTGQAGYVESSTKMRTVWEFNAGLRF